MQIRGESLFVVKTLLTFLLLILVIVFNMAQCQVVLFRFLVSGMAIIL